MNEILTYLVQHMSFLYTEHGARFVDSRVEGANALLVLELPDVRLRLVFDRGQLFLDFQSSDRPSEEWYSIDVVEQLIIGQVVHSAELDDERTKFVKTHLSRIATAFARSNREKSEAALHKLEHERAERLFG